MKCGALLLLWCNNKSKKSFHSLVYFPSLQFWGFLCSAQRLKLLMTSSADILASQVAGSGGGLSLFYDVTGLFPYMYIETQNTDKLM